MSTMAGYFKGMEKRNTDIRYGLIIDVVAKNENYKSLGRTFDRNFAAEILEEKFEEERKK
jgi:hypothetical protein